MRIRPSLLAATLVAVISSLVLAGQVKGPPPPPPPLPPGPLSAAVFGKVVAGDVTGDLALDAVVLDGGLPTLGMAPEVYDTSVRADSFVSDIVCMQTAGVDRLFAVGGSLLELVYDTEARDLVEQQIDTGAWSGAFALATGAFDSSDEDDLVGLSGTSDVLILQANGEGGFEIVTGFQTFMPAYDVLTIDWDGDGTDELAFSTDYGIEVYEPDSTQVDARTWVGAHIAVVQDPDHGERLAVIAEQNGVDWVLLWGQGGVDAPRNLGALDLAGAAAADVDGDGDSDLLLSLTSGPEYALVLGQHDNQQVDPSDPLFSVANMTLIPFGDPQRDASANQAGLVTGDFDRDGDVDVMAPATGNYLAGMPDGSAPYSEMVLVNGSSPGQDVHRLAISGSVIVIELGEPSTWQVDVDAPAQLLPAGEGLTVAMEVEVWETPELFGFTLSGVYTRFYTDVPTTGTETVAIQLPEMPSSIYSVVCRQVLRQGDIVVGVGPSASFVNGSDGEAIQAWLGGVLLPTTIQFENGSVSPGGGGATNTSTPNGRDDEGAQSR